MFETTMKGRHDESIDIIKFVAVFLIINSHADICYPKYSILATGGAIGDCAFLFVSGFTLFRGELKRFDNYYRRRISRIFPSVISCCAVTTLLSRFFDMGEVKGFFDYDFINAIMVYYVLLYLVRRFMMKRIEWVIGGGILITLLVYVFWFPYKYETSSKGIYGITTLFRWIPYFSMMLMGAMVGLKKETMCFCFKWDCIKAVLCLSLFYGIQMMAKFYPSIAPLQIITVFFLAGIVYYVYKCFNADIFMRLYYTRMGNWTIMAIGGLCLESYLIQFTIITDKWNFLFPFNIPIVILMVLLAAYIVRCIARIFIQTFRTEDFEWRKVFVLK